MITIYDVAKAAGVSPSTVSRVLNDEVYVKESTVKKVNDAIKKTGYSRRFSKKFSTAQGNSVIGIILPDIRNPHHSDSIYAIEQTLNSLGYSSIICNATDNYPLTFHYLELLMKRKVEGIILVGSFFANGTVRDYLASHVTRIPIVIANGFIDLPNVYGILSDDFGGMVEAVEYLISKGRKNIVFVQSHTKESSRKEIGGYRSAVAAHSLQSVILSVKNSTLEEGARLASGIIDYYPYTDAIVFDSPFVAVGCCKQLLGQGLQIPANISVVTVDNVITCDVCYPSLTCIDNQIQTIGVEAARTIDDLLHDRRRPTKITISTCLVEKESS